jgi:hypothetical protein
MEIAPVLLGQNGRYWAAQDLANPRDARTIQADQRIVICKQGVEAGSRRAHIHTCTFAQCEMQPSSTAPSLFSPGREAVTVEAKGNASDKAQLRAGGHEGNDDN